MFHGRVLITELKILAPGYYLLTLSAPEIAALAKPGQFIQLRVSNTESNDPLLARPISIYQFNKDKGSVSLLFKTMGRGTAMLASKKVGELLDVLGPVGNGFTIPESACKIALIAGGIGMPPLFGLTEYLQRTRKGRNISLFYGGRTGNDLLELERWAATGTTIYTATDDGSSGRRGLITELFLERHHAEKYDFIVACGPKPMLQAVQQIALAENIPGQLSLEANMACGVGACLGCSCKTNQGYRRVCVDGPVFPMDGVEW